MVSAWKKIKIRVGKNWKGNKLNKEIVKDKRKCNYIHIY